MDEISGLAILPEWRSSRSDFGGARARGGLISTHRIGRHETFDRTCLMLAPPSWVSTSRGFLATGRVLGRACEHFGWS
jgi:hypothetical protein